MAKTTLKWGDSNTKVVKMKNRYGKILTFDIPAGESANGFNTCPGKSACYAVCYARQGTYNFPTVRASMEHNLKITKNPSRFVKAAIEDLKRLKPGLVRLHSSGDLYSQAYINAWFKIARQFPDTTFYCYTKSHHLFDVWTGKPDNFAITQSEGGIHDDKIDFSKAHSRIFATHYARRKAGYSNASNTDLLAIHATDGSKLGFAYHGTRNLSEAQKKYFT